MAERGHKREAYSSAGSPSSPSSRSLRQSAAGIMVNCWRISAGATECRTHYISIVALHSQTSNPHYQLGQPSPGWPFPLPLLVSRRDQMGSSPYLGSGGLHYSGKGILRLSHLEEH